jgi:hypothetical protein
MRPIPAAPAPGQRSSQESKTTHSVEAPSASLARRQLPTQRQLEGGLERALRGALAQPQRELVVLVASTKTGEPRATPHRAQQCPAMRDGPVSTDLDHAAAWFGMVYMVCMVCSAVVSCAKIGARERPALLVRD